MKKLGALVVEDEAASCERLQRLLRRHDDVVEVLGVAGDGPTAIDMAFSLKPALLFLDITLPACDGFEVVHQLPAATLVIFTTANEQRAVEAFRANAVDYLLKPIDPAQLAIALERARLAVESHAEERLTRLLCREQDRIHVVQTDDVLFLRAEGGYTHVQTANCYYLSNESLLTIEKQLGPDFARVHRATVVNMCHVRSLEYEGGELTALLEGGHQVSISRRHSLDFRRKLSFGSGKL